MDSIRSAGHRAGSQSNSKPLHSFILTILLVTVSVYAGAPQVIWETTIPSEYDSRIWGIDFTDDGGAIAVGEAGTADEELESLLIMKLTPQGELQWQTETGWDLSTVGQDVLQVQGGYLVCGSTFSNSELDGFIAKFDYFGNEIWCNRLAHVDNDVLFDIAEATGGMYIAAGYTESTGAGGKDFWLVLVNSDGELEWTRSFGTAGSEVAYSVVPLSDGGYAICGGSDGNFHMVICDEDGNGRAASSFNNGGHETARCIIESDDGGFLLVGSTMEDGGYQTDTWLVSTDSDCQEVWSLELEGDYNDCAWDAVELDVGGFVILSNTMSRGSGSYDTELIRMDPWGNIIWQMTVGDSAWNTTCGMALDEGGSILMGGRTWSDESGSYNAWAVETGPEDLLEWP